MLSAIMIGLGLLFGVGVVFCSLGVAAAVCFGGGDRKLPGSIPVQAPGVVSLFGALAAIMGGIALFNAPLVGWSMISVGGVIVAVVAAILAKLN
ncbi:MAG: hypothetical protein ACR2PI_18875 [Hyphomicrobiaceae bacterium]